TMRDNLLQHLPPLGFPVTITVLRDASHVRVFSAPGGYLYLTTGLLAAVGTEAQLAAVLAHEMVHETHRDVLIAVQDALGPTTVQTLKQQRDGDAREVAARLWESLLLQRFSDQQEALADKETPLLLVVSRYEPTEWPA